MLASVFKDKYNFSVEFLKLTEDPRKKTQVRLMRKLSAFVDDNDDEDTLLIIYYAGHGFVRDDNPGQMELRGWKAPSESGTANKVLWNSVEKVLDETSSDVLEVMDCCYAGDLGEPKRGQSAWCNRSFEYIAATSAGKLTNSPGDTSFTSALIWALNQFALPESRKNFTVTDLVKKIRECPNFPKDQVPLSSPRNIGKIERMVLAPLPTGEEAIQKRKAASREIRPLSSRYNLHLNFDFNELPTIQDIEQLANELKQVRKKGLNVSRVSWEGLRSGLTPLALEATDRLRQLVRDRKKSQSSQTATSPISPQLNVNVYDVYVPPKSNHQTPSTPSQQSDLQSASFHLKMFLWIIWATILCIVASMTDRARVMILILTAMIGLATVLTMILAGDAPEL